MFLPFCDKSVSSFRLLHGDEEFPQQHGKRPEQLVCPWRSVPEVELSWPLLHGTYPMSRAVERTFVKQEGPTRALLHEML